MIATLQSLVDFLSVPGSMRSALRAPRKSLTSLAMVGRMRELGVDPMHVMDIGANQGQFSSAVLAIYPQAEVIAVEPLPEAAAKLGTLFRETSRVRVVQAAVGSSRRRQTLFVNEHSHSSSLLPVSNAHLEAFPDARPIGTIEVDVVPIDELLPTIGTPPDFLKIDIQGAELDALTGAQATLPSLKWLLLETSFSPLYTGEPVFSEYHDFLMRRHFHLRAPLSFLRHPRSGTFLQMDVLYEKRTT